MKLFLLLTLMLSCFAFANEFKTNIIVEKVFQTKNTGQIDGNYIGPHDCSEFKGTYAGNRILVRPLASGGSGSYSHTITFMFPEGYADSHGQRRQQELMIRDGRSIWINLPELREDTSFIQQNIMVITRDLRTGKMASNNIMFNVTRPVLLKKSRNPEFLKNECKEVYPAKASPIGILTNSSSNPSQLMIKQGVQKLWTTLSGSQWGFYFSPLSWTVVGNLFMINRNYFTQYSKQVLETVEISSEYVLSPGDYVQIYEQKTRYVSAFDAYTIDVCGNTNLIDGEYMLQWWGVAYHAIPINPFSQNQIPIETIGMYPQNSCDERFTPEFSDKNNYNFVKTN